MDFKAVAMEICHLTLPLPQEVLKPAKRNLVKLATSDGETNMYYTGSYTSEECMMKWKKIRPNTLSNSISELHLRTDGPAYTRGEKRKQKLIRLPSEDDLWKCIRPNYDYLMENNLITVCQETRKELYLSSTPPPSTTFASRQTLAFPEFVERFNTLHDKLHSLYIRVQENGEINSIKQMQAELWQYCGEFQYLRDQAIILELMNPDLKDDISRRSNILSNKWQLLEGALWPKKKREREGQMKSTTTQITSIRKWLREVESKLRNLNIHDGCSEKEITEIYNQEKILQREIEERGKELTSLVRQCESLEGATVAESKRLRRSAARLERCWHNIWIRSLEKQCLAEQRLGQRHSNDSSLNVKEASDLESDEGPLRKHRRLSFDHWIAAASTVSMDRLKRNTEGKRSSDSIKSGRLTRDIGILCNDLVPVNDKCIMVGTTGIAALKAKYGDDFTNFEIIQDVGYSSESSTHLSGDDGIEVGGDRYFNIRVYNYNNSKPTVNLREEVQNDTNREFSLFGSSLESSSPGTSLDDSGLGTAELFATGHSSGLNISDSLFGGTDCGRKNCGVDEEVAYGPEDEYLENVLDHYVDFFGGEKEECSADENLHFDLSGIESDDPADNFHNRSSFTTSAQKFYKILSVDSDNGDLDSRANENIISVGNRDMKPGFPSPSESRQDDIIHSIELSLPTTSTDAQKEETKLVDTDSEPDTYKPAATSKTPDEKGKFEIHNRKVWSSTPVRQDDRFSSYRHQTLKRKRDCESTDFATTWQGGGRTTNHVRTWLKRCADYTPRQTRRALFRNGNDQRNTSNNRQPHVAPFVGEDASSCDASGEYTSSSADEGNAFSSSSSFFEDETFHLKTRVDSCSVEGSIETVLPSRHCQRRTDLELPLLLPPPPSSTPPSSVISRRHIASTPNIGHYHVGNNLCKEPRFLRPKASSEGDIGIQAIRKMKDLSTLSDNSPGDKKCNRPHPTSDPKSRLYSSLPSMLRLHSDSSTDEYRAFSLSHSDTKMTYVCSTHSTNHSSSSEVGKRKRRRSRKKSSSSNRSSISILLSGDNSGRQRSRTLTSGTAVSLSCCGSRRRHFSQRSDFFAGSEHLFSDGEPSQSEVKIPPEELDRENMNTGLELTLDNSCARRDSSVLLSNVESDVVLTQLEEQSTVSDQVWDGYQDMPYLSEAYSEATVDEDAVRKLTEFGDDYGSAIGLPRLLDSADGNNNKAEIQRSPSKKSSKSLPLPASQRLSSLSNDSDSDSEDLHHVLEEAVKALHFARAAVKRRQSGDFFTSAEYAELLATCGTHLRCLGAIYEHIETDGKETNFSASDLKELQYLIEEWEILRKSVEMYEKAEDHVQQKYLKAQENIDALFNKMSELSSLTHVDTKDFHSWEELKSNLTKLQMVLSTLQETKQQLLAVNLQVHRFTTEHGDDLSYKDCSLKEDVTELYRQWEDTYEQNGAQLTELQTLDNRLEAYDVKYQKLRSKVKEAELLSNEDYDKITAVNGDGQLRKELKELRYEAGFLESRLKGGVLWKSIDQNLRDLSRRIEKQTRISPVSRSAHHQISSVSVEDDTDDHFEDAIQQLEDDRKDIITTPSHSVGKEDVDVAKKSGPSRFWRVVRVAVPVQFALVLLYCLACYLEPHCCDMLNNFNFSLSPQLRYLRGPPPV